MSKTVHFKVFCLEQYKNAHHLSGKNAFDLFKKYGVLDYLSTHYDVLHTCGVQYIVQEINRYIEALK